VKVETNEIITITLTMTAEQASWLKGVVQNEIMPGEDAYDARIRKEFWDALEQAKGL